MISIVASQQEGPGVWSLHVLQELWLPPTVQGDVVSGARLTGKSKFFIGVSQRSLQRRCGCLCVNGWLCKHIKEKKKLQILV